MLHLAGSLQQPSNPLAPSLTELIVGGISFFIVFGALWKVLLPRITKTLAERTDAIEGGLQRADDLQQEARQVLERYKAQLDDARHEASRLREQAREQGAQIIAEMRAQGQAEYARLTQAAQAQIDAERQQALASLRTEIGALSVELASRIVGESLADQARQRRTVERFLEDLEQQAAEVEASR
jgi:F-type H+-transporting ATPase subunit b